MTTVSLKHSVKWCKSLYRSYQRWRTS